MSLYVRVLNFIFNQSAFIFFLNYFLIRNVNLQLIEGLKGVEGIAINYLLLTLCIRETPKRVFLQTVKTQMKCSLVLHFIRVYTVCKVKKDLQTKEYTIF